MADLSQFIQVTIDNEEKNKRILTNVIKMLTNRKLLNETNIDKHIESILKQQTDTNVYLVNLDNPVSGLDETNNKKFYIKLLNQKITTINKTSGILDFLLKYDKFPTMVIVKEYSKKAYLQMTTIYTNSELFLENELMINIVDHILVPKHEVLQNISTEEFLKQYKCKKKSNLPKLLVNDPIAKYYKMKVGDICRITRASELSGFEYFYRLVVRAK
jgi:DNA-directed RNA polymerase subunit H (RpoH/RPB5)